MAERVNGGTYEFDVELDSNGAKKGLDEITDRAKKLKEPLGATVQLANNLGSSLGGAVGPAGQIAQSLIGAFAAGGVVSLGLAAVTSGIGILIGEWRKSGEAAEKAAEKAKAAVEGIRKKQDELNEKLREEIRLRQLAQGGYSAEQVDRVKTLDEYRAELAKHTKELAEAERNLEWLRQAAAARPSGGEKDLKEAEKRVSAIKFEIYRLRGLISPLEEVLFNPPVPPPATPKPETPKPPKAARDPNDDGSAYIGEAAKKRNAERDREAEDARVQAEEAAAWAEHLHEKELKRLEALAEAKRAVREIERAEEEKHREQVENLRQGYFDLVDPLGNYIGQLQQITDLLDEMASGSVEAGAALGAISAATAVGSELIAEGLAAAQQALADWLDFSEHADRAATKQLANRILANKIDEKLKKESQRLGRQVTAEELSLGEKKRMADEADAEAAKQRKIDRENEQLEALASFMNRIASEAAISAIMETARGFATIEMPPIAASHFTAAAVYAGVAVAAGAAGAAISANRGETGAERTANEDADRERQRMLESQRWDNEASARDMANRDRWGEGTASGPNITIQFTGQPLLTQEEIGRAIEEARKAYQQRWN